MNKFEKFFPKLRLMSARYSSEPGVSSKSVVGLDPQKSVSGSSRILAIQTVSDKIYLLLFGAIAAKLGLRACKRVDLVVVRSINGAVGVGWLAEFKRSALIAWLLTWPWLKAYAEFANGVAYRCATWAHPFRDVFDWYKSKALWVQLQQQREKLSLQIGGIEVADLVVDSYLRFKPAPEFDVKNSFVRRLLWQALRDVRQAHDYFGRAKPRLYLTSYTTYLEHGIPARVALCHNVEVWSFGNLNKFGKKLTKADTFHTPNCSKYKSDFEALKGQEERLESAKRELETRFSGGIDVATSYMRRSAYDQAGVVLPSGLDGAVVIFLHDFYDSPHVYAELVFDDFWRWICFTIEVLQKNRIAFFLKPHPNQIALSDEALDRLREQYRDLKWLPSGVSNVQLVRAGIACGVTVYGTVSHELAYLGVPSIGSARHPHHAFDFCRTARNRDEYESMLKTYAVLPVPKEEMQRQALAFYYMHNLHGDEDQLILRQAFVDFWKVCNLTQCTEESVMTSFRGLKELPAFGRFVEGLANT